MPDGRAKNGGKRSGAGRKAQRDLDELQRVMDAAIPYDDRVQLFEILSCSARSGNTKAAALLLAYLYGRPVERHEHTGEDGAPIRISHIVAIAPHGSGPDPDLP